MIDKNIGTFIKYLEGGILYIYFYIEERYFGYRTVPSTKKGAICVEFLGKDEPQQEFIKVSPEFDASAYQILHHQVKDQITLVCIPLSKIHDAVPFKLKNKVAERQQENNQHLII